MSYQQEFTIKHCSSETPSFPSKNLQDWNSGQAWKSGEFPETPVQLICQLKKRCKVNKIQMLGHQYMIPQKVVLFIGDFTSKTAKKIWRKIGFFTFLENPLEDQRELKTINLSQHVAIGQYIKFEIYEPYNKKSNLFNKVAVDAINILGEEIRDEAEVLANRYLRKVEIDDEKENIREAAEQSRIKLDAETDLIVTRMMEEKAIAEQKEDFDMASALKNIISTTRVVGEQIYQCDKGKDLKVKQEEYEEAKGFKIRRDELKLKRDREIDEELYQYGFSTAYFLKRVGSSQSTVTPLDEIPSHNTENEYMKMNSHKSREEITPDSSERHKQESIESVGHQLSLPVESSYQESAYSDFDSDNHNQPIPNQQQINSVEREDNYSDPFSVAASDDRSLANNQRTFEEILAAELAKEAKRNGRPPTPDEAYDYELKEKTKSLNKFDVLIFGEEFCLKAIDKAFQPRLDAATDLQRFVENDPVKLLESKEMTGGKSEQRDLLRSYLSYIEKFMEDLVQQVYLGGIEAGKRLIATFAQYSPNDINTILEMILPILLRRSQEEVHNLNGAAPTRVKQKEFIEAILDIHAMPPSSKSANYITKLFLPLSTDFKSKKNNKPAPPKLYYSRLEILIRVIKEQLHLITKHWRQERLFEEAFARIDEGIRHQNSQVRGKACELLYLLYSQNSGLARNLFEEHVKGDGVEVKNDLPQKMIDTIYDEFDRLDGKPTKKQLEAERKKEEAARKRAEQAEIEELQRKIAAARQANREQEMRSGAQYQAPRAEPVQQDDQFDEDEDDENSKQCIFCLEQDDKFIEQQDEKDGMDMHYWKECPMLTKCKECKMVIEISGYNEHLVKECPSKANYQDKNLDTVSKNGKTKCPLCSSAVTDTEEGWREHLMAKKGCKNNDRRVAAIKRKNAKL